MKLFLKNIGKIGEADIEINGITVIAGENNVGKSTVGKALFFTLNVLPNLVSRVKMEKLSSINNIFLNTLEKYDLFSYGYDNFDSMESFSKSGKRACWIITERFSRNPQEFNINFYKDIVMNEMKFNNSKNAFYGDSIIDSFLKQTYSEIKAVLEFSTSRLEYGILNKYLNSEFNGQVCNIYNKTEGQISLNAENINIEMFLGFPGVVEKFKKSKLIIDKNAVYFDDPFIIDSMIESDNYAPFKHSLNHKSHLIELLTKNNKRQNMVSQLIIQDKLDNILKKLNEICSGELTNNNKKYKQHDYGKYKNFGLSRDSSFHFRPDSDSNIYYKETGNSEKLNIKNLSAGLKSFVILKTLLLNGSINSDSVLILDEPEIHLHPEWQLIFAEIIVLLQKEFDLHILLNTHSPYFLNALEIYAAKHDIGDKCKYYLAETEDNIAHIKDVTDNIEAIYYKLARPLQKLEDEKGDL